MKDINTQELSFASNYTKDIAADHGDYVQIDYDMQTGEILCACHCDPTRAARDCYNDDFVIFVGTTNRFLTEQEIADLIHSAMKMKKED